MRPLPQCEVLTCHLPRSAGRSRRSDELLAAERSVVSMPSSPLNQLKHFRRFAGAHEEVPSKKTPVQFRREVRPAARAPPPTYPPLVRRAVWHALGWRRLPLVTRRPSACITARRWARTGCGRSGTPRACRRLRAGERRWTWGAAGCGRSALGGSRATRPCYTAATRRARRPAAPPAAARARATATRRARLPAARQAAPQPCPASSPARRATCCLRPHCRSPRSVGLPPAAASAPAPAPMRRAGPALGETRRRVRRRRRSLIKGKFAKRSARYHPTRPCASAARLSPPRSASSPRHVEASSLRGTLSFRSESVQAPRNRGRSALLCRSSCCSACSCCWQALASGPEQGEQEPAC